MTARDWWIVGFIFLLTAPLITRLFTIERQDLGPEVLTTSGLLATGLLVCVIALPSRIRSLTRSFGIEKVMEHHRSLGVGLALLVLIHVAAVVINDPRQVGLVVPFVDTKAPGQSVAPLPLLVPLMTPPYRALAGLAATVALVALAGVSPRAKHYDRWRLLHITLVGVTLLGAAIHILLINHLVPTYQFINFWFDPLGWPVLAAEIQDPLGLAYLILLFLITVGLGIHRWVARPLSRKGHYTVRHVRQVAPTVHVLTLHNDRPSRRHRFRAGQFAWLRLHKDPFGEEHPFTATSAEHADEIEFTIRDTGSWTARIPDLRPGDRVWLDGPHGNFTPKDNTRDPLVMIAGGVGLTPMLSILRTVEKSGRHTHRRPIKMILTDRPETGLFRDELSDLSDRLPLTIEELNGRRISAETIAEYLPDTQGSDFYICGSPSLVTAAITALTQLRVSPNRIHTEQFDL